MEGHDLSLPQPLLAMLDALPKPEVRPYHIDRAVEVISARRAAGRLPTAARN